MRQGSRLKGTENSGRQKGFTLVELLVSITVVLLLYGGVSGLFTTTLRAWTRGNERMTLYPVGTALVDSIIRDARTARDAKGTTATLASDGVTGNSLVLVLNSPARWNSGASRYEQKQITYQNTTTGFKRTVLTAQTTTATADITAGTNSRTWTQTLTRKVVSFQFERYNTFTDTTSNQWAYLNPRIIRFFITLGSGTGQLKMNGRTWIRRSSANANVPSWATF